MSSPHVANAKTAACSPVRSRWSIATTLRPRERFDSTAAQGTHSARGARCDSGRATRSANRSNHLAHERGPHVHHVPNPLGSCGAVIAICLGAGGIGLVDAAKGSGERSVYTAIEPCRLLDTRPNQGIGGRTAPLGPGEIYPLTAHGDNGQCTDIPADTLALELNVTGLFNTGATHFTVWDGQGDVPNASHVNLAPGASPTPNSVTTELDGPRFAIFNNSATSHVIVDIVGIYQDHTHDDRYYTESEVDAALAPLTTDWVVPIPLGSIAEQFGTAYNSSNFSGPVGIEIQEGSASIAGTVGIPAAYDSSTGVQINLDLMPGDGSTAPCTVDLDVTSGDTQRSRPGDIQYSLGRDTRPLDVTLDPDDPVRAYVSFDAFNGIEPGDTLAFRISRDHDDADTCTGDVVVTGMSLTPNTG